MGENDYEMNSKSQDDRKMNHLIVTQIQASIETFDLIPYYSDSTIKGRLKLPKNFKCRHSGQEHIFLMCSQVMYKKGNSVLSGL